MANILIAWELGAGTGHLHKLANVGGLLARRGHRVTYAAHHTEDARQLLPPSSSIRPAPHARPRPQSGPLVSYADILAGNGYSAEDALEPLLQRWRAVTREARADRVVADHAPTALLAARCEGIPAASLGSGFLIPPHESPLPPFDWVTPPSRTALKRVERTVHATVNAVLTRAGAHPLEKLADLLAPEERFLLTHPRLDHYPRRPAHETYWGLLTSSREQPDQPWPPGTGPCVLGYLRTEQKGFEPLLRALGRMKVRALIHAPDCPEGLARQLAAPHLRLTREPLNLHRLAAECDFGVGYGGPGFVTDLLRAGKPLLLAPIHMEQAMLTRRLFDQGCAEMAPPHWGEDDFVEALSRLIEEPSWSRQADAIGQELLADAHGPSVAERVADRCETLLRASP